MSFDYKKEQRLAREALVFKRDEKLSKPPSHRKMIRQKLANRKMTKKGYAFGVKIDSKEDHLIHHIAKRQGL